MAAISAASLCLASSRPSSSNGVPRRRNSSRGFMRISASAVLICAAVGGVFT